MHGSTVYVAPDGHAAMTIAADRSLLEVDAGSGVPATAADLAAILLSIPH
jgi:hypothetical protein